MSTKHSLGITGALIIHNDASLLDLTLKTIAPYVDRLLVVDGAYRWVSPFCRLHNEDPEKSTDNMISLLDASGIPYDYYSDVWESETHKRMFSIEQAKTNLIMTVDSDELCEIDILALRAYQDSDKVFGQCNFPLYLTPNVIGHNKAFNGPPRKPIFINKKNVSTRQIVDSLYLLVPDSERTLKLPNQDTYQEILGTVHHVSTFRSYDGSYRRARFYSLLAMRIAGNLNLLGGGVILDDSHFFDVISNLENDKFEALDTTFAFHRIAAGFPNIKTNQFLVEAPIAPLDIKASIIESFERMRRTQSFHFFSTMDKWIKIFSGKSIFLDVSELMCSNLPALLKFEFNTAITKLSVQLHIDHGLSRESIFLEGNSKDDSYIFDIPTLSDSFARGVLEVIASSLQPVVELRLRNSG